MISDKTININSFDFLRFLFAFNILLGHLAELSQCSQLQSLLFFSNTKISIDGFFVVSGFLVAKSYCNSSSIKSYFVKRAKRILPAYLVVIALSTLLLFLFSDLSFIEYFVNKSTWLYFLWNSIFLNFMHPCLPGVFENNLMCTVNGALWTIKIEEGFYIILPLLFFIIKKIKRPVLVLTTVYLLSIAYSYLLIYQFNKPELAKQLPGSMAYFSVGILIYFKFDMFFKYKYQLLFVSVLLLFFNSFLKFDLFLIYPLVFGIIVISLAYSLTIFKNFGKYGDFTYGLYICHFPIIQITRHFNLYNKFNPYLIGILVVTLALALAILSWNLVEKRFLDRFKEKPIVIS